MQEDKKKIIEQLIKIKQITVKFRQIQKYEKKSKTVNKNQNKMGIKLTDSLINSIKANFLEYSHKLFFVSIFYTMDTINFQYTYI